MKLTCRDGSPRPKGWCDDALEFAGGPFAMACVAFVLALLVFVVTGDVLVVPPIEIYQCRPNATPPPLPFGL